MSLLAPLGLLGLLSVAVLILIYIIKPNYQQKFVSSTFVWKLSLKYRKKSVPINRIRNILIFICQLLILTACALILAYPVIAGEKNEFASEKVIIIDASASMQLNQGSGTRFSRAVSEVTKEASKIADDGGVISVILADTDANFVVQRANADALDATTQSLDELVKSGAEQCSFGSADLDGAVKLAESVLAENPDAKIVLYTATTYLTKNGIEVVDVSANGEWNAAVLDVTPELVGGYYKVTAKVACYGRAQRLRISCSLANANEKESEIVVTEEVSFDPTEPEHEVVFDLGADNIYGIEAVYLFDQLDVYIDGESDSFSYDNSVSVYGNAKPTIKIQYSSTNHNIFTNSALIDLKSAKAKKFNLEVVEVAPADAKTEGYDFYVFEHAMPDVMPEDGVVLLFDPDKAPDGSGLTLDSYVDLNPSGDSKTVPLKAGSDTHPIINKNIKPEQMGVTQYRRFVSYNGYRELINCNSDPVLLIKDDEEARVVVFGVNIHKADVTLRIEYPFLIYNIFTYFIPYTVNDYVFEVGDTVTLNAMTDKLNVSGPDVNADYSEFPRDLVVMRPGTYTLTQTNKRNEIITERFFVGISNFESNILKEVETLPAVNRVDVNKHEDFDLLIYIAAVLVALLFVEWWLQSREYFR